MLEDRLAKCEEAGVEEGGNSVGAGTAELRKELEEMEVPPAAGGEAVLGPPCISH
jgi:hypothetical protein